MRRKCYTKRVERVERWESCTCAVPVDEPDSSAWLSVWGVNVCRFGFLTLAASKHPKFNITTALEDTVYENCGGKGTGMMGGPTVVSMQCAASKRTSFGSRIMH